MNPEKTRYRIIRSSREGAFLIVSNITLSIVSKPLSLSEAIKQINNLHGL